MNPSRYIATIALPVIMFLGVNPVSAGGWKAGAARGVITPTKPMWMAGYAVRDHPAEGKLNDLWVKALALEDESGNRAVLVTLDVCGIDRALSNRIRDRLLSEYRLGREWIALSCSHTHSGPMVGDNLRGMNFLDEKQQGLVNAYTADLEEKIVTVAGQAIDALAPAEFVWTMGKATFAVNRRENPEPAVPELRAKGELKGPVDHDLPVLAVMRAGEDDTGEADDEPIAIVFGYACHATTTALYEWSSDWPGVACANVEQAHPGAVAMCWIGCGGDQNPVPRQTYDDLASHARAAAHAVEAALASGAMKPVMPAKLVASYSEIDLPFATLPTREQLAEDEKSPNKYSANRAKILLARLDHEGRLSPHYPYPVQLWRLGSDLKWVLLGGEVVVDYSLRLKKELGLSNTWVTAYANDVMAYIPSRRILAEGGYEGSDSMIYYAQPTTWAPEVEELIVREVHRQVDETK